jgi:hypothetical protein
MEVLQNSFTSYDFCEEVVSCSEHGALKRMVSSFAFQGQSDSADKFQERMECQQKAESSGGCACSGTESCMADSVRAKYGLD